jgi:hypothetical protein
MGILMYTHVEYILSMHVSHMWISGMHYMYMYVQACIMYMWVRCWPTAGWLAGKLASYRWCCCCLAPHNALPISRTNMATNKASLLSLPVTVELQHWADP